MDKVVSIFSFIVQNYQAMLAALVGLLSGVIGIALLIPGPEPETTLQKVVDFLAKFSKK
jgi:hypothetical protein